MMKNKNWIIIGVTLIIIAAISMFLIRPVIISIWSSWQELNQTQVELKILEEKKQIINTLKNNSNFNKVADIAEKYIPQESESGQLVIELSAVAANNNLKVKETSLDEEKETSTKESETATPAPGETASAETVEEIKTVDFSMTITGSFSDFMNFVRTIETSTRLIALTDLSLQMQKEGEQTLFSAQITGSAYYKTQIDIEDTVENIQVSDNVLKRFLNLRTYGQPIDLPVESGFGRINPFEGY